MRLGTTDRRTACGGLVAAGAALALRATAEAAATSDDRVAVAADAFIYAFPMLMNYKTLF